MKKEKNKIYVVDIVDNGYTEVTRHADPDERWDGDDLSTDHSIEGFNLRKESYGDLEVGFEPDFDKTYFLLYGIYSTGDSFHHEEGRIEFVDLYEDGEVAWENYRRLEASNEYTVTLKHETGKEYGFYVPWRGYFESLTSLDVLGIRRLR